MVKISNIPVALTVAGSDSSGGAGIQTDLKTFHSFNAFGTSAITCVTAQNVKRVSAVHIVPPRIVTEQMDRIFEEFTVAAAKTGMLYTSEVIESVTSVFKMQKCKQLVVDPVIVATSGTRLLRKDAMLALQKYLIPQARLVTPNIAEAELLSKRRIINIKDMKQIAQLLSDRFCVAFLVKGGHLTGSKFAVDICYDGKNLHEFSTPRVRRNSPHGTGCTLSAGIAASLALGSDLLESIHQAKQFLAKAIKNANRIGKYRSLKLRI